MFYDTVVLAGDGMMRGCLLHAASIAQRGLLPQSGKYIPKPNKTNQNDFTTKFTKVTKKFKNISSIFSY
jgi:hypothetical protein